jgi:hypothetical protein
MVVDFGPGVFVGASDWLHLAVQTNGGNAFASLLPRQQLSPTPYAIFAEGANASGLSGTIPSSDFSGTYGSPITLANSGNSFSGNGGGLVNVNASLLGGLGAGSFWQAGGNAGVPTGSNIIGNIDNQYLDFWTSGVRALRLRLETDEMGLCTNAPNLIGGSSVNSAASTAVGVVIAGGGANFGASGLALPNTVTADFGTVSGGIDNIVSGSGSSIGGGGYDGVNFLGNVIQDNAATIGGGLSNNIPIGGADAFIGGGGYNTASGYAAMVGGGGNNTAAGEYSTVPGGSENSATGTGSFAAGLNAAANNDGSFIWSDFEGGTYSSDRDNQFKIRAGGGVQMDVSGSDGHNPAALEINSTSGNGVALFVTQFSSGASALFANSGAGNLISGFSGPSAGDEVFSVQNDGTVISKGSVLTSDRNAKDNFTPLDLKAVLAKVVTLPVTEWNYRDDPANKKHIGPVAQDFQAAFGLNGKDDKHISVVDEGGVALAAIQGLNQKLQEKDAKISELEKRLDVLEQTVQSLASKK